jgi:CDP-glucose 4,6-dehydratase
MEGVAVIFSDFQGKRVLVTGHTGFKGSWLCSWLARRGAKVVGYALEPYTPRDNYYAAAVEPLLERSAIGDIRDADRLRGVVAEHHPEVVFHLAAQPLVRLSYERPSETLEVNVVGTANLLDAVRLDGNSRATVVITSDKCYQNNEWPWGYREVDTLGGRDPYSASKAAAELVVSCYRDSYFANANMPLASTRAGNVIGGGDWSADRLVPDAVRALEAGEPIAVRNPASTRPWQHVLEPLGGYLLLAARMMADPEKFTRAYNFGPDAASVHSVGDLCDKMVARWGSGAWTEVGHTGGHEAGLLALDCARSRSELGWRPLLSVDEAVSWTIEWYRRRFDGADVRSLVGDQIDEYEARAESMWTRP